MSEPPLGSATRSRSIMDLRMFPWGPPRFYLPGEHPATFAYRHHRESIAALLDRHDPASQGYADCCEVIAYIDRKLAEFEAGEDEAKRIAWMCLRGGR